MRGARRRQPQSDPFMLLLFLSQLWNQIERLPVKPIVTLAVIGVMVAAHVEPALIPMLNQSPETLCLSSQGITWSAQHGDMVTVILRVFGSILIHGSDHHMYYNVSSFLWKGTQLETALGPGPFGVLLVALVVIAAGLFVVTGPVIQPMLSSFAPATDCAYGFSIVLFALKYYIYNSQQGDVRLNFMFGIGFSVAAQYATWVELLIVHYISPHTSFFGHLCGIGAGAVAAHTHFVPVHYIWMMIESAIAGAGASPPPAARPPPAAATARYTYTAQATGTRGETEAQRRARLDEARNRRWQRMGDDID